MPILYLLFLFWGGNLVLGQAQTTTLTKLNIPEGGLKIGDKIPEEVWNLPLQVINHPEGKEIITLNDYRGKKLIILEFWGSRCPPCIKAVDFLDSIQNNYNNDLGILPILTKSKLEDSTYDFIKKKGWMLPSVINDTVLDGQVFSQYLSDWGDVWILDGHLLAVPKYGFLGIEAIESVLNDDHVNFVNKSNARPIDPRKPIFEQGGKGKWFSHAYASIGRYMPQYDATSVKANYWQSRDTTYLYTWNRTLEELYFDAFKDEIQPHLLAKDGIVWELSDVLKDRLFGELEYNHAISKISELENWKVLNNYGYDLRIPELISEKHARQAMQQDLNKFFGVYLGLEAKIEPALKHKYAVLRLLGTKEESEQLLTKDVKDGQFLKIDLPSSYRYNNFPFGQQFQLRLTQSLKELPNANFSTYQVVVDSTGINGGLNCYFEFPKAMWGNLDLIQEALKNYGLYITIEEKEVPVLVVRQRGFDKKTNAQQAN